MNNSEFPYKKGDCDIQRKIRKKLDCCTQFGINFKPEKNYIILFKTENKLYKDRYDSKLKRFYYTGEGREGNQTCKGRNKRLADSKDDNIPVHLFWQPKDKKEHCYQGLVIVEKVKKEIQTDKEGKKRNVFLFILKPVCKDL